MDFSRPDNARRINRLKVLNALRSAALSRAELSRELLINKVSISEIVDGLIRDGLIVETEKEQTTGRPATKLGINRNAGRVFSVEIRRASVSISVSDTLGRVLRFERVPRKESLWVDVESACLRLAKGFDILGVAIVTSEDLDIDLPWPYMRIRPSVAEAKAEIESIEADLDGFYFVSWSDQIDASLLKGSLIPIPSFAHLKVAKSGICKCKSVGCLEAVASANAIKESTGVKSTNEIVANDSLVDTPSQAMAFALSQAVQATGARSVMITGELAGVSDRVFAQMQTKLTSSLPEERKDVIIFRAGYKEGGLSIGASLIALEEFFYNSKLLDSLRGLESSPLNPLI